MDTNPHEPQETRPGGFHVADGLYFRQVVTEPTEGRGPGIAVEVSRWTLVPASPEAAAHYVLDWVQLIDEGSWCSVVSSMSAHGESTLTFGLARALHIGGAHR